MFTRLTRSGGRTYLQIVESFRDEAGKPRLHLVANLGRVDGMKDGQLDALIRGLSRVAGRDEPAKTEIAWEGARSYGDAVGLDPTVAQVSQSRSLRRSMSAPCTTHSTQNRYASASSPPSVAVNPPGTGSSRERGAPSSTSWRAMMSALMWTWLYWIQASIFNTLI